MESKSTIEMGEKFVRTTVGKTEIVTMEGTISVSAPSIIIRESDK